MHTVEKLKFTVWQTAVFHGLLSVIEDFSFLSTILKETNKNTRIVILSGCVQLAYSCFVYLRMVGGRLHYLASITIS